MILDADIHLRQGAFTLQASFCVPYGITVLFGPSGSGKSSILAALAGLKRMHGHVTLGGRDLQGLAPHRRGIGLVFQDTRLFPHLSVRGNIAYAWARAPRHVTSGLDDIARFFDIAAQIDRPTANLSGGEKSRVALARAVAAAPDYLLLDEPFAALDGARRRAFIRVLLDMHRTYHLPMLVVTHDIEDAAALATHLVALRQGKVVAQGRFAEAAREAGFRALLDPRDVGAAIPAQALHSGHVPFEQALWLKADHVLLAAEAPRAISARNVLEGSIAAITQEGDGSHLIELVTGAGTVLSRLTGEAVHDLGLTQGKKAWALVKAHAL
jgi:molybdate transport system ATP-binding protein